LRKVKHDTLTYHLIKKKGNIVNSLSLHTLIGSETPGNIEPKKVYMALMGYTTFFDSELQKLKKQASASISNPKIAITELQIFTNKRHLPNNKTLTEALFLAGIIHSSIRQGELIQLITHSALVNHGGGLCKQKESVFPDPVHWASHLYGNLPESFPVMTKVSGNTFNVNCKGFPNVLNAPFIDVLCLLTKNKNQLIIISINRHPSSNIKSRIKITGFTCKEKAVIKLISGKNFLTRNSLKNPDEVQLKTLSALIKTPEFEFNFLPCSITGIFLDSA